MDAFFEEIKMELEDGNNVFRRPNRAAKELAHKIASTRCWVRIKMCLMLIAHFGLQHQVGKYLIISLYDLGYEGAQIQLAKKVLEQSTKEGLSALATDDPRLVGQMCADLGIPFPQRKEVA